MSKTTVYNALQQPRSRRHELSAALTAALLTIYATQVRTWMWEMGYGDHELSVNDPAVVAKVKHWAEEQALTIVLFSNELLSKAIDALPEGLSDSEMLAQLDSFYQDAATYNAETLVPYNAAWAKQQATLDFFGNNDFNVLWRCVPGSTDQTDDCLSAIEASPMTYDEAQGFTMPNHQQCPHSIEPIIPPTVARPDLTWTGAIPESDAEAA